MVSKAPICTQVLDWSLHGLGSSVFSWLVCAAGLVRCCSSFSIVCSFLFCSVLVCSNPCYTFSSNCFSFLFFSNLFLDRKVIEIGPSLINAWHREPSSVFWHSARQLFILRKMNCFPKIFFFYLHALWARSKNTLCSMRAHVRPLQIWLLNLRRTVQRLGPEFERGWCWCLLPKDKKTYALTRT